MVLSILSYYLGSKDC